MNGQRSMYGEGLPNAQPYPAPSVAHSQELRTVNSPGFIVRYIPVARNEKVVDRAAPTISEHVNRVDAEEYAVSLVRGGLAEWGSIDLYENRRASLNIEINYPPQDPPRNF